MARRKRSRIEALSSATTTHFDVAGWLDMYRGIGPAFVAE
jgi:hypothetical protein